jgi:hypothetical protein
MRYGKFFLVNVFLWCILNAPAQPKTDSLLKSILSASSNIILQEVLNNKDSFRVQVIYTQIDRDKQNRPSFHHYYYHVDSNIYFNPASTVKLPLALLALEKLNLIKNIGVGKYTAVQIDSNYAWQKPMYTDPTSENGYPSIAHFIKKAFLVSDNDAYNRLYQFIGPQTINRNLHEKGYPGIRITRQFLGLTLEQNRHTNAIQFLGEDKSIVYTQPPAYNPDSFYFGKEVKLGRGYMNNKDSLINEPIDFTRVNNLPLEDLQQILQSVLFPESVPDYKRFRLTKDDYQFLYQYLSQFPSETNFPRYDSSQYYDSYVKFFFRDSTHHMPAGVRVFNKVGWAYGFLIDASYIADFKNHVEYMLNAVIYVNKDGILNDDKYEYDEVGWPFMYQLGQAIYQYELKRPRKKLPNLNNFRIEYEKRNPADSRPMVKNVDN